MGLLALVLAVLVWAVVWRDISTQDDPVEVRLLLETSPRFTAIYDGRVDLTLRGPRGEIERARRSLGTPPVLNVRVPDLAAGEDHREIQLTWEMISLPFPRRLVQALSLEGTGGLPAANVYRVRERRITFLPPEIVGVPEGIAYDVVMAPAAAPVRGPAGKIGGPDGTITPDKIDLSGYFREGAKDLPGETKIECAFDTWRTDPENGRHRAGVKLPTVQAVLTFRVTGHLEITNRLVFDLPPEYEVLCEPTERYAEGRYRGLFAGRQRDLDRLKKSTDAWWFVVRVPSDKLPAEDERTDAAISVEFFRADSLSDLRVSLATNEILLFTIKRR